MNSLTVSGSRLDPSPGWVPGRERTRRPRCPICKKGYAKPAKVKAKPDKEGAKAAA